MYILVRACKVGATIGGIGKTEEKECTSETVCAVATYKLGGQDIYGGECINAEKCEESKKLYEGRGGQDFKVSKTFEKVWCFALRPI